MPVLPTYVERPHDRLLRTAVNDATQGISRLVVLVGGSSTGKTRACWEAIQALKGLAESWLLWHPIDPGYVQAVTESLPRVAPRTVLWLNETQHYLLTTGSGPGERVAAGLRELMRDPARGPVLILGSIWPEYWATLTAPSGDPEDSHAQARALLAGTDINVPETFASVDLDALSRSAVEDPRLAEAHSRAEDGQITQYLAGAPALLDRHRNAPPAAKALIDAAMDARRVGHGPLLPHAMLVEAAPGYLTDFQWDELEDDWLDQALAYTAKPCHGARAALTRVRPRPNASNPQQPCYRLADYLDQTGRATRLTLRPPATLWEALTNHVQGSDLFEIARNADARHLYRYACYMFRKAGQAGEPHALWWPGHILQTAGRFEEALSWYEYAATSGDTHALSTAARMLQEMGRIDEAMAYYQRAARAGESFAVHSASDMLYESGRSQEAINWLQTLAEAGNREAISTLAVMLDDEDRIEEAIPYYQQSAATGDSQALFRAVELLEEAGRNEEAIACCQRAAEAGAVRGLGMATYRLENAGRGQESLALLNTLAEKGNGEALAGLAYHLGKAGQIDEAIACYQRAAKAGLSSALQSAAELAVNAGRTGEAIAWLQSLAEARNTDELGERGVQNVLERAVKLLQESGPTDEAIRWLQTLAQADDLNAQWLCTKVLTKAGRAEEAISWLQTLAENGNGHAPHEAAELLQKAGRAEEAIGWLQAVGEAGNENAVYQAFDLLKQAGRDQEAIDWLRTLATTGSSMALTLAESRSPISWLKTVVDAGNSEALWPLAMRLEKAGQNREAIAYYKRAAEAGHHAAVRAVGKLVVAAGGTDEESSGWLKSYGEAGDDEALHFAIKLLKRAGRLAEAIDICLRAIELGSRYAPEKAAALLKDAGRGEEATRLLRYGIEPGGQIAELWEVEPPDPVAADGQH